MDEEKIIACYNKTAAAYAAKLFDELAHKPFDRLLLKQFAYENKTMGKMIDLGCGPGQITQFLAANGVHDIMGVDISSGMIDKAKELNNNIEFQVGNMMKLDFPDSYFASAIAFYAIVHFSITQLELALLEINRILINGGPFLIAFHIGNEVVHFDEFLGAAVDIDFYFFQTETVLKLLKEANFKIINAIERFPYESVEYQSKRAYIWAEKKNPSSCTI